MDEDSKHISLLDESIESEFCALTEQRRIFDISLQELEKNINTISYKEPSSIQQIKNKFEEIQKQMKNMNDSISYIKNFLKNKKDYDKLNKISKSIYTKYKNADDNFKNALRNAENDVQNQINKNLGFEIDNLSNSSLQEMEIDTSLTQKNKIERLKNVQKEYQQIYNITVSLSKLSQDINASMKRSEEKLNNIEDNLIDVEDNTKKGNEELREFRDNNNNSNSVYIKFSLILFIVILIIGFLTYSRLSSSNNSNRNVNIVNKDIPKINQNIKNNQNKVNQNVNKVNKINKGISKGNNYNSGNNKGNNYKGKYKNNEKPIKNKKVKKNKI